jgi:putative acetyltransferase
MPIEFDSPQHCDDFIRLNEQWIQEHFAIEEADRQLAADPWQIVRGGGHWISLVIAGRVVGVCALVKEDDRRYQLARMAVEPSEQGKGYGSLLITAAIQRAQADGAMSISLLSNTKLRPAISLYQKHGFRTLCEGPHPVYARCNIVMELSLTAGSPGSPGRD